VSEQCLTTDRGYLTSLAYANQEPLAVRIATHRHYTVPPVDLMRWVLDLVPWQGGERVLDVGCGDGQYREPVVERLTGAGQYLAGDLSLGMLRDLPDSSPAINLDVATLPLSEGSCDVILANHMLYHAPDVDQAVAECHRALRGGGRLLAATNSQTTMTELSVLIREGYGRLGIPFTVPLDRAFMHFSLENGRAILARRFDQVERHLLRSALVFPEPAPLLAYIDSMRHFYRSGLPDGVAWEDLLEVWRGMVADHIARHGAFHVGKVAGAFVAVKTHPL
jgi:SAM-dependent methyltransferase